MKAKLEFILGRAGSGRTRALFGRIERLKAAGSSAEIILIVPEQATFETERLLSEYLSGGLFGITVTSWSGLSRRVLDSLGNRRAFLSPQGRVMLLRRSADARAQDLTVFRRSAASRGFPAECDELIKKFKRCGLSAQDLESVCGQLEEDLPLRAKLHDVSLLFADHERRCAERYIDPEDMMNEMLRRMGESVLRGAHVFIDGGDTLHEQAYPVFAGLLEHAASVTAALVYSSDPRDRDLFAPSARALKRLESIAAEAGVTPERTYLNGRKRPGAPAILHMEHELFAYPADVFEGEPEGLSLLVSANRTDEVTECAELICEAARGGTSFRDIAVIVSDLVSYSPIVSRIFAAYGIPYFTDASRSLATHPAALLILSALRACESGFALEHIAEIIKSGYADITPEEAERFENLLIARGFFGSRLKEPFTGDDAAFESVRRRVMEPLLALSEELKAGTCEARARAIHSFMETLDVYGRQKALCEKLHGEGRFREEEENAQVVNTILEVLDQLYVIMGGERIGLKRFIAVLKEGFEAYEVGLIPTTCDQVLVGSMDRTRSREVKLLCVLGMNDGLFPKKRSDDGVFDDGDLEKLKACGLELWPGSRALSEEDMLTVYSALSKASERIVFSYPASIPGSGEEDASALPCRLVSVLKRIFPLLPVRDLSLSPGLRSNKPLAFSALARRLRRMIDSGSEDAGTAELFSYFSRDPGYRLKTRALTDALYGQKPLMPFGQELSKKLYGSSLYGSASRLEAFNRCPFMHYARYGLDAKERPERTQKVTDRGTFFHEAIETYVRYVIENELDWREITDDMTFTILHEIIPPIMYRENSSLLYDTARQRAALPGIIDSVKYTCCAVTRHIARGSFRPSGCEVSFGRADSVFPPLSIETGSGVVFRISGIIDRIDSFTNSAGETVSRIIDYKSGGKEFRFGELEAGLQLQLPLYAAAVEAASTVGMYYMPISDIALQTDESGETVKELTEELLKQFRLSGLSLKDEEVIAATEADIEKSSTVISARRGKDGELTGSGFVDRDEYELVIRTAMHKAAATLERIFEGDASVSPCASSVSARDNACRWCPYGDICRFDEELSKTGFRKLRPVSASAFFGRDK